MRVFTYKDYLYYKKIVQEKSKVFELNDINQDYEYKTENDEIKHEYKDVDKPHDKMFKQILKDKKEVARFLNDALKLDSKKYMLRENDIIECDKELITRDFFEKRTDAIYRKKNTKIFFHIEHQSTIDYSMPYRILKYNVAIMDSVIDITKLKRKEYKLPLIFSFVIYTGEIKWNASKYIIEKQEKLNGVNAMPPSYFHLIDVNDYESDELLKKRSLLSKVMALEKSKDIKDFIQVSNKISEMKMPKEHKDFLSRMIYYIFKGKIGEDNANKLLNKLTNNLVKKEGDGFMFVNVINNWIDEAIELAEDITRKQEDIDRKQEDIDRKQEDIDRKQEDINTKQADIEQREENIEKREKNIKKGEKIIAEREKNMQQKEREIKRRQDEIIIEMIKKEISEDLIIEIAKIDKKELERIKKVNKL